MSIDLRIDNELDHKFSSFDDKEIVQGHILKFIKKGKPHVDKGIICFPQQTYGNAEQSPQHFKGIHTLVPKNGYVYRHEDKPQFKYYSQKRYFSIDGSAKEQESKFIHFEEPQNRLKFHRKKGKLTQFMDKNGWMSKTTKLMGFERDERARGVSNMERAKRIDSLKPRVNFENVAAKKPNTSAEYFRTIATLTSRKTKIRSLRNDQASRFSQSITQPCRTSTSHHRPTPPPLAQQTIQTRMLQTAREWSPSKIARTRHEEFNKTARSGRAYKFQDELEGRQESRQYSWRENHEETLEDWYRTTCSSKWVYNKKLESEETEGNGDGKEGQF